MQGRLTTHLLEIWFNVVSSQNIKIPARSVISKSGRGFKSLYREDILKQVRNFQMRSVAIAAFRALCVQNSQPFKTFKLHLN